MAVSGLSPVSTQTTIPADIKAVRVSGTPSCSLSSMPIIKNYVSLKIIEIDKLNE